MARAVAPVGGTGPRRGRTAPTALVCICLALAPGASLAATPKLAYGVECVASTVTAPVIADSWIDEDSPLAIKGSDSILSIEAGSYDPETGLASGRSRTLIRFEMPADAPPGCVVDFARLLLWSPEESVGTRLEAIALAAPWAESQVTWTSQPATSGAAVGAWSREGYMRWNVTTQVQTMIDSVNHGFLVRDSADGSGDGSGGSSLHSREHGDNSTPPRLVIEFAAPDSGEPPGPPLPPAPATVACGQVITQSTLVMNDLLGCLVDGLVIGAPNIILDLDGHTIDGIGLGSGIRNDGFESVTVMNGSIQEFDYGVQILEEGDSSVVEGMTLTFHEIAAIELFDVANVQVRRNTLNWNGGGIRLVSGTTGAVVRANDIENNRSAGILVADSDANSVVENSIGSGHDLGIWLERASGNLLGGNTVVLNSDGGIEITSGSHGNTIEHNTVTDSGDHGILVEESDGNVLLSNISQGMSDNGILLQSANGGIVSGNDVRFNSGGIQLDGSSGNQVEMNNASETTGIGIELGGGSFDNSLALNTAHANGSTGIYLGDEALTELGNVLDHNTASGNQSDGIVVAKGGHTLVGNEAHNNHGWGIIAGPETFDGGLNVATANGKIEQCAGVICRVEWIPPETTITEKPADPTSMSVATFRFTGSDQATPTSDLRFECSLDSAVFASCASPRSYSGLSGGRHRFDVRAIDRAGNIDPFPASHSWTVQAPPSCPTLTASANADAWLEQDSPAKNHGADSVLKLRSQSGNKNFRALVRFALPATPPGCVLASATLRLYAGSYTSGRTLRAISVGAVWSESSVSWGNQPVTTGAVATITSGSGYRAWTVTTQVRAMYETATNYGFLIRDAAEGGPGSEQQFNSREKSNNRPQLVLRFAPAP